MPQIINTNIASLNAQRNLNSSQTSLATSLQRLSSGLRINSAKDDAAGLAITNRMTTQIRGTNQAIRNASDGISLAQTGEGALAELAESLQRIRELAVQAANATNSTSDRAALNLEVQQRLSEIDRVSAQTSFNGRKILDGSFGNATFQVGPEAGQIISLNLESSTRLNSIGKIVDITSGALGSQATGGYLSLAGITPADFSQVDATAASGKVSFTPTTLSFGTPTAGITYGSYAVAGVTPANMSASGAATNATLAVDSITAADFSPTPTSLDFTNINLNQSFTSANHLDFTITSVSGASYNIKLETDLSVPADLETELNTQLSAANADVRAVVTANGGNVDVSFVNWDDALNQAVTGPTAGSISVSGETAYGTATTALAGGVQTNGDVGAQFSLALPGGGAQALTLTGDYSANDAGAFTAMAAELDGLLAAQNIDVTSTGVGNLTFTYSVAGPTATDLALTAVDGQATTALAGSTSSFVDGLAATPTANSTFTVSDGVNTFTVTLTGDYSVDADANDNMIADIQAQLGAGEITVAKGTGAWDLIFTSTTETTAVTVTADTATLAGWNADNNGFLAGTSFAGSPATTENNATFEVDGNQITLDQNYLSLTDLATGSAGSLQAKLNVVAAGVYQVSVDGSSIVISKSDIADLVAPDLTNTTADPSTDAAGIISTETPTAGNLASTDSSISFMVDGTLVTLTGQYDDIDPAVNLADMIADLGVELGAGYTVEEDPDNPGSILITNNTPGSPAVVISDADANAQLAGFPAGTVTGVAGVALGSVTLAEGDLTIKVGDNDAVNIVGTFTTAQDLAYRINQDVSGIFAEITTGNKLRLMSPLPVLLSGTQAGAGGSLGFVELDNQPASGNLTATNVTSVEAANETIVRMDSALTAVSSLRSTFGAIQNRFESTISSLSTTAENLTASRSRILDADFAAETASLTRAQILQQAGVAMLAQANALPQQVLRLLQQ